MPYDYHIDAARRVVFTRFHGVVTDDDLAEHVNRLRNDPTFDPSFSQLTDGNGATKVDVTSDAIRRLVESNPFSKNAKRAGVASRDVAFGLLRMYELLADSRCGEFRVFRDVNEARAWLGLD